jgi:hypothetical protein
LTTLTHVSGPSPSSWARPLATARKIPPAIDRPASQPSAKAGPFDPGARRPEDQDNRDDRHGAYCHAHGEGEDVADGEAHLAIRHAGQTSGNLPKG